MEIAGELREDLTKEEWEALDESKPNRSSH